MGNQATLIAALAIAAVVFFAIWDDTPSSRLQGGACDTGGRDFADIVTLTTATATTTTDNVSSLQSPNGTFFVVPSGQNLAICHVLSALDDSPSAGTRELTVGYSANTVSNSATQPATSTILAFASLPDVNQVLELNNTLFKDVPEGNTPWVRFDPGFDWGMTLTAVLIDDQ